MNKQIFLVLIIICSISYSQSLQTPTPLSPGTPAQGKESVDSDKITFTWQSVKNADGYAFFISEFDGKDNYNLIYDSKSGGNISDTTYTLDNKIFKHNIIYSWNVQAKRGNEWSGYSERFYFKIKKVIEVPQDPNTVPDKPVLVSPGNNSYEEESTTNLPVVLKWNKIDDVVEYAVYVNEKQNDGEYILIYNSQQERTITDTTFLLPDGIFEQGSSYRWNLRAAAISGWGGYSSWKYFRIVSIERPVKPNPMLPGALTERSRSIINTLVPKFVWYRVEGSSFYNVIISRKSIDGSYNEIYNNDSVPDIEFQIPDNVIKDSKIYKWNVRALIDSQWTEFSKDLFFSPLIEPDLDFTSRATTAAEPEEVYLSIKYAGVLDGMVSSIFYKDKVFLPVSEVFTNLEINNEVDYDSNVVSGDFILQDIPYYMDFQKDSVYVGNSVYSLKDEDVIETDFDYFISIDLYKEYFGINFVLDFSSLAIKTYSDMDLPILSRHIREKNYAFIEGIRRIDRPDTNFGRNRSMFNFGLFDYHFTASIYKDNKPTGLYSFALGGEILGGDVNVGTRGIYSGSDFIETDTEYLWRYVFQDEKYITSVSGGYLNSDQGLENFNYRGVKVTNEPIEPRRGYGTYRIFDVTNPNWTVELYISSQLVDISRADAAGNFHFDIPLSYGTTLVQLKYYGPGGEYYTADKLYQTPFFLLKPEEFNYALNIGEIPFTYQKLANLYGGYGFTKWLTNKTGIEYIENSNADRPVFYNSTTARVDGNYLFNLTLAPNTFYSLSANVLYYDQTSIDVSYTNYQNHGFYNLTDLRHEATGRLFVPIRFEKWQMNIQGDLSYKQSDNFEAYESLFGLGAIWSGFNPFVNYRYSDFYFTGSNSNRSIIDAGFSLSIYRLPTFLLFMKGNILNARTYYSTNENRFESYSVSFSTNVFINSRFQISYFKNLLNDISQTQLQLIVYFPFTQYSVQYSGDVLSQSVLGSIGYDHNFKSLKFYARHQIGRAAVSFKMFVDDNGNEKYDSGEEIIKDGTVSMGTSVFQVDNNGIINAYELNPYTYYTVKIIEESIKNPLLIPKHKVFGIVTDPNNFKAIEIPFYVAGEISGNVYRQVGSVRTNLSGIKLHIESLEEDFKTEINTFLNGSFYYFGLKPGKYRVYINHEQLNVLDVLSTPSEMEVDIKADPYGDFIEDLVFVVE